MFRLYVGFVLAISWLAVGTAWAQKSGDTPGSIATDAVRLTKQATVMLKVVSEGGRKAEGSGFFALESGLVVTNAHVLGMLQANSKSPTKIEVIVGSGTVNEYKLTGKVLGVERSSDLALLRVEAKADTKLPIPLQFGKSEDLVETQKVYIFGFPFGSELGRNITVSESSVSSLRTDERGQLTQVQVNGGMHPGNSGGPVVNTSGQVVGVAVSGIRNTQINFAIPADLVKTLFDGSILEWRTGELFRDQADVRAPLQIACLDPLQRIREVRLEVWTGKPTDKRPFSPKEAKTLPGDSLRQKQTLKYAQASATGDVLLPKVTLGQVVWVQPVLVLTKGPEVWGLPRALDPTTALERTAVELNAKLAAQKLRTVQLKAVQSMTISAGKRKAAVGQSAELKLAESFASHPRGAVVTTGFGVPRLTLEEDGEQVRMPADVIRIFQAIPPRFVVDETNKLRERADINLNPQLPQSLRDLVNDYYTQVLNGYEAANFVIPNRRLQPRETWSVSQPMLLKTGKKAEVVDLVMTCTYEGLRTVAGNQEALVTFTGKVVSREPGEQLDGAIAGRFTFDVKRGFIASLKSTIASEISTAGGEVQIVFAFNIDLTRSEGNPDNIPLPNNGPVVAKQPDRVKPEDAPFKGLFKKPDVSKQPTNYMKIASDQGDFIGQGKNYDYKVEQLTINEIPRGLFIRVDGWNLQVGGPARKFVSVGEYPDAKRFAFSGDSPGLDFSGKGRGSNKIAGAFAIWELDIKDGKVLKLALDFEQHSEGKTAGLRGKVRVNSSFE